MPRSLDVLIACEFSGRVRDAFTELGHNAWSCDLLPTESDGAHFQEDVLNHIEDGWDLMIAHPPCTHLASSGARWFKDKQQQQQEAIEFVLALWNAPIDLIAIENPVGILSKVLGLPDQIVHPYWFGDDVSKATCLWLQGLPLLAPTHSTLGITARDDIHKEPPGPNRWKNRSRTFLGMARQMALQWGGPINE